MAKIILTKNQIIKMSIDDHISRMRLIQQKLLSYLKENKHNYQQLITKNDPKEIYTFFDNMNIRTDEQEIIETLHLIMQISNYHHQQNNFCNKIDQILSYFKEDIKAHFTNYGIYNFF